MVKVKKITKRRKKNVNIIKTKNKKYKTAKQYKTVPYKIPTNAFQKAKKNAIKKYNNNSPIFKDAVVAIMSS